MKASVVVVGVENPLGRRWMNSRRQSRRAALKPDVRSGIVPLGEVRGQPVQQRVAQPAAGRGLGPRIARADHEVVVAQPGDEPLRVPGRVLAVGIDDGDPVAGGGANRGLHRGAIALVVGMAHDPRARVLRRLAGAVGRAVVDHQHLMPRRGGAQLGHDLADAVALVEGGHDDRDGVGRGHQVAWRKLMMSPSWTTYSLPSSRSSPLSRHAAIEPRR